MISMTQSFSPGDLPLGEVEAPLAYYNMTRDMDDFIVRATVVLDHLAQTNERIDAIVNASFPLLQLARNTTEKTLSLIDYAIENRFMPRMSETMDGASVAFTQTSQLATDAQDILHSLSAPHVPWILLLCVIAVLTVQTLLFAIVMRSVFVMPKTQARWYAQNTA